MSGPASSRFVKAFPNWVMTLHRTTGKQSLRPNEYVFKVPKEMTKFDIRQYMEKLYGVKVESVNTVRYDGACHARWGRAEAALPRSRCWRMLRGHWLPPLLTARRTPLCICRQSQDEPVHGEKVPEEGVQEGVCLARGRGGGRRARLAYVG